jgi:hypothetical protein
MIKKRHHFLLLLLYIISIPFISVGGNDETYFLFINVNRKLMNTERNKKNQ